MSLLWDAFLQQQQVAHDFEIFFQNNIKLGNLDELTMKYHENSRFFRKMNGKKWLRYAKLRTHLNNLVCRAQKHTSIAYRILSSLKLLCNFWYFQPVKGLEMSFQVLFCPPCTLGILDDKCFPIVSWSHTSQWAHGTTTIRIRWIAHSQPHRVHAWPFIHKIVTWLEILQTIKHQTKTIKEITPEQSTYSHWLSNNDATTDLIPDVMCFSINFLHCLMPSVRECVVLIVNGWYAK